MKPKGEVNYIAVKQKKPLWIAIILILILFITLQIAIITKLCIEIISLSKENQDLKSLIEAQKSQLADIQEDNIKLQEMIK